MRFRFEAFELETQGRELRRDGRVIELEPKPFRILLHLLARSPQTVSTNELTALLWPSEHVTNSSLYRAVSYARRALTPSSAPIIQTVRGGYRIGVAVERLPDASAPHSSPSDPFVGRRHVLAAIERAVDEALRGVPRAVLLTGEPGVGKTRTAEIVCACDSLIGAEIIWGRCLEGVGSEPLRPWRQVLGQLAAARSADELVVLLGTDAPVLAELSSRSLASGPAPELPAEQRRLRFLDTFARLVAAITAERALVLVLDDLHYGDEVSLALWAQVVREVRAGQLLLIGMYRDVAAPPNAALDRLVAETALLPAGGAPLALKGLSETEVGDLVAQLTDEPLPESFVSQVRARTGGNPLFVRSLVRGVEVREFEGHAIPDSIRGVVRARVHGLAAATRAVLEAASVLGRDFEVDIVAAATTRSTADCLEALDDAFEAGLVAAGPDGTGWRFVHVVVAECLYEMLAPGRRAQLHYAAARAFEEHEGYVERDARAVAHHYQCSLALADPRRVLAASLRACELAERSFLFEDAGDQLEAALAALDRLDADDAVRFECLIRLVALRRLAGPRKLRLDAGVRALAVARRLGARAMGRTAIEMYDVKLWSMEVEPEAIAAVEEALDALRGERSPDRAHLLALQAHIHAYDDLDRARKRADEAVAEARAFGPDVLRETLYVKHYVLGGPDHLDERDANARELISIDERSAASEGTVITLLEAASDALIRGDPAGAAAWRARVDAIADLDLLPGVAWSVHFYDTGLCLLRGDLEEADRLSLLTLEAGRRSDQVMADIGRANHLMFMEFLRGEHAKGADRIEQALAGVFSVDRSLHQQGFALNAAFGARFSAECGRRERASELVSLVEADAFRCIPREIHWLVTIVWLAHACALLGSRRHAEQLDALLAPVDHLHAIVPDAINYSGSVIGARARLLELLDRRDEARAAYERAVEAESAIGSPHHAASSRRRLERLGPGSAQ